MEEKPELLERESAEEKTEEKFGCVMQGRGGATECSGAAEIRQERLVLCHQGLSETALQAESAWDVGKRVVESQAGGGRVFSAADVVFALLQSRRDTKAISHHACTFHSMIHNQLTCPAPTSFCTNFFTPL